MKNKAEVYLKIAFLIGAVVDGFIAVNWLIILTGINIPSITSGYIGSGISYKFSMFINTLFMTGWTSIMYWASFKPEDRKEVLLITFILIFISVIGDFFYFRDILKGPVFIFGITKRIILILIFSGAYFNSIFSSLKKNI